MIIMDCTNITNIMVLVVIFSFIDLNNAIEVIVKEMQRTLHFNLIVNSSFDFKLMQDYHQPLDMDYFIQITIYYLRALAIIDYVIIFQIDLE